MKTSNRIFITFILNLFFAIFEFIGGILTNSVAIVSDAVHDLGDCISLGLSYFLEKISLKKPDNKYTFGYVRYSVLGSLITTVILISGSILVIYKAIERLLSPVVVNYNGMIIFAIIGFIVNLMAAYLTRDGHSLNEKSVNLHMLEDVLGWLVVLIGAVFMKIFDLSILDPILSIGVALFILINAFKNFKKVLDLFVEKTPKDIEISAIKKELLKLEGILDVHHIHVWSMDGFTNYATMHIVSDENQVDIKEKVRDCLHVYNIEHVTIEIEKSTDLCHEKKCKGSRYHVKHHH